MQIIKLDATTSTNTYLRALAAKKNLSDFTVVVCDHQIEGRGQKGNSWTSEKGKNLTVSVLKRFDALKAHHAFILNASVSRAIYDVLKALGIADLRVKWPNDIMSGEQKLCGILIENSLQGEGLRQAIIGFGLNVNQEYFADLPQATSLKLKTQINYDLNVVLEALLHRLSWYFNLIKQQSYDTIFQAYEAVLFRKDSLATYATANGERFEGKLLGVIENGQLKIKNEDTGAIHYFGFKEISYIY